MVRLLLDRGADINRLRGGDYTHALEAVICEDRTDAVHLLLDSGASVKLPGDWDTPLLSAVYVGNVDVVLRLLRLGVDTVVRHALLI
ncbi:hypothetical protein BDW62DRAFT_172435 [Aspergillus aurantiobrunneus]